MVELPVAKLNKDTLEATLTQIEYLKGCKKDQILMLSKLFDGKVTAENIDDFEKTFRSIDSEGKNEMPVSQMSNCLRLLQQLPIEDEVKALIETVNPKKPENAEKKDEKKPDKKADKKQDNKDPNAVQEETIDFFKFLHALALYVKDPYEIFKDIKESFRTLDRNKQGYLYCADIRDFLSKQGDLMTDEEIDEMIKLADLEKNGQVRYEEFVDLMFNMKAAGKGKKGKKSKKSKKK